MSGAGFAPFGTSPFGIGTPTTSSGREGTLLTDANGTAQGSRNLDARTKQWTFDSNGRTVGMENAGNLVLMYLSTVLNSSAWAGGLNSPGGVIGSNFAARRQSDIRTALKPLTDNRIIRIDRVTVDVKSRPVLTFIDWHNLLLDKSDRTVL